MANKHDVYLLSGTAAAFKDVEVKFAAAGLWIKEAGDTWTFHVWHHIQKVTGFSQPTN